MDLLYTAQNLKFYLDKTFSIKHLIPIQRYVQWKLENDKWDDYNEFYHATNFMEIIKSCNEIWLDSHLLSRNDKITGVLFIIGGEISKLEKINSCKEEMGSLLLKYFHIEEKGHGYGSLWLKSVIIPYYKEKGYNQIYVGSSHVESFPFYSRLGTKISEYEKLSDNNLNKRIGNRFLIKF